MGLGRITRPALSILRVMPFDYGIWYFKWRGGEGGGLGDSGRCGALGLKRCLSRQVVPLLALSTYDNVTVNID